MGALNQSWHAVNNQRVIIVYRCGSFSFLKKVLKNCNFFIDKKTHSLHFRSISFYNKIKYSYNFYSNSITNLTVWTLFDSIYITTRDIHLR
jgi:hypothetical protein